MVVHTFPKALLFVSSNQSNHYRTLEAAFAAVVDCRYYVVVLFL